MGSFGTPAAGARRPAARATGERAGSDLPRPADDDRRAPTDEGPFGRAVGEALPAGVQRLRMTGLGAGDPLVISEADLRRLTTLELRSVLEQSLGWYSLNILETPTRRPSPTRYSTGRSKLQIFTVSPLLLAHTDCPWPACKSVPRIQFAMVGSEKPSHRCWCCSRRRV